ncbi:MAG TPA: hypothetical protein VJA18_02625 [Candidatus Nanoarchaeia archaeon]|nr:hypothetical protein [Candidatus Nanoarchaeia archaeon]
MVTQTPEYGAFKYLQHWKKEDDLHKLKAVLSGRGPLFTYLFQKAELLYNHLPARKDGAHPFLHPLNVVLALRDAKIDDEITLSVGLLHDYVEEIVDIYRDEHHLDEDGNDIELLDKYESEVFVAFEKELLEHTDATAVRTIIAALKLLTRHKRDFYYRSISNIFQYADERVKEIAIQVKLADRTHNILSIECFSEEKRNYQCFKNLFILNNTKKYLLENPSRISTSRDIPPTQLLFKRCAKATYDAYQRLCYLSMKKGIGDTKSMMQLAFKKFALERSGMWAVTKVDPDETHLMRLFQGVVRKYDARLHHEWEIFEALKAAEYDYCRKFFADFNFTEEQIKALVDYKDSYSLKEVVSYLLYLPDYVVHRFLSSELTADARICN